MNSNRALALPQSTHMDLPCQSSPHWQAAAEELNRLQRDATRSTAFHAHCTTSWQDSGDINTTQEHSS
jgi:hypothetical protein